MANVLIIDDDEFITALLSTHLMQEGHSVAVAHQGQDGMALALKAAPDLIMLDVMLPDATGFQLCSQFRRAAATRSTPIIMMTGVARFPNQRDFALQRGANSYLFKPFEIEKVVALVESFIGSSPVLTHTATPQLWQTY